MLRSFILVLVLAACGSSGPVAPVPVSPTAPAPPPTTPEPTASPAPPAVPAGDRCEQALRILRPVFELHDRRLFTQPELDEAVGDCRKRSADDPAVSCVLAAKAPAAAKKCLEGVDWDRRPRRAEPNVAFNRLGKAAKALYAKTGAFPIGTSRTLPATPCCRQPQHQCASDPGWKDDPIWLALDFSMEAPSLFQYRYESTDGKTITAVATADPHCDGTTITFKLDVTTPNGAPMALITEAPPDHD